MAPDILQEYQYSALTPGSRVFRAIRLLSPQQSWHPLFKQRTLRIQIEDVQVDSGRPYECLSYTWAVDHEQVPDRRVIVETGNTPSQLFIHQPLESALFEFYDSQAVNGLLFVDQICLNQHDDVEKADQVPLMQDIYAKCTRTVVWLGPGTRRSNQYFDFVRSISEVGILSRLMGPSRGHFMEVFDAVMDRSITTEGTVREDVDDLRALLEQYAEALPFAAMKDVLTRPWFTRLWIIQEVCLPPEVTFVCGSRSLCFDCFRGGSLFLSICSSYLPNVAHRKVSKANLHLQMEVLDLSASFIRIYQERRAMHISKTRRSAFATTLRYSVDDQKTKIGASRAEDRVYGLMGLIAADDSVHKMTVRYKDVVGVYTEFAALQAKNNLDILCYSQFPKIETGLPSWVPDWTMELQVPRGYTKLEEPHFAAGTASGFDAEVTVDDKSLCLSVRGVKVDRITKVGTREITMDTGYNAVDRVDDRSAKHFFEEADEFLELASGVPGSQFRRFNPDEDRRADAGIRLADNGLSERYLQTRLEGSAIREGLRAAREQSARVGQMLLKADAQVRSYRMDRIFQTVGIVPWYWVPMGSVDLCHAMVTKPIETSIAWARGAAMFVIDVLGMCLASAVTTGLPHLLRLRSRFTRVELRPTNWDEKMRRHGLAASVEHSEAVSALNDFMYKNRERRLYLTEEGHVGLGPRNMQAGDAVVVLYGGTVPHVLREQGVGGDGQEEWSYVGEAYCDGIMDGELLEGREASESTMLRIR
ncbi:heterokaryon incompatibility protein (HET) domain-containing protein [Sarocladium implicatum]|nr:heterokaryon incompatibility protein (HET) domain-containing protein [Sarocladium implicatum]